MNMPIERSLYAPVTPVGRDLSGMPEAFRRAYGPTEAFPDDLTGEVIREDCPVLAYRGQRRINPRSRSSCRIFAVYPDLETGFPRIYGMDSGIEHGNLVVTLIDPRVRQVHEQFGPVKFRKPDGTKGRHYFDLLITYKTGRRVAVAVKPTSRLASGRFLAELEQIKRAVVPDLVDEVRLVTEQCFSRTEAINAATYLRFSLCPDAEADARLEETVSELDGELTIADLIVLSRTGSRGFRAVYRAIFEQRLGLVSRGSINLHSIVRRPQ
ncbi:hypothetical protein CLG85_015995 [Yangia mangrovi]|uniref:TnsA endonuclease N-terminal domain-containing protein n=1 Tax=Alloyangia mangrovi TaxID=1779329 RepID=A0ABT2KNT4_9RHOB|nr:TnsA endonuclease N-terminal domain-containing protein [Alloyangia mangrovi]MCT4371738.1 hypothetical protein [Alloyangia mangrovi]